MEEIKEKALEMKKEADKYFISKMYEEAVDSYSSAQSFLENYIQNDSFFKNLYYHKLLSPRAHCYEKLNNYSKAIKDYDTILEVYENHESSLSMRANCYEKICNQKIDEGKEDLEQTLELLKLRIEDLRKLIILKKDPDGKFRQQALMTEEKIKKLEDLIEENQKNSSDQTKSLPNSTNNIDRSKKNG